MPGFGTKKRHRVAGMRHRAWLQKKLLPTVLADQTDDRGQSVFTWTNLHEDRVPISIQRLYGGELERARQLQAGATHRVEMRQISGVASDQRFLLDGRALYIGDVDNLDESNRFLVLICEEKIL